MTLPEAHSGIQIKISADCKYKLYVNGTLVSFGPTKGDNKVWFFDELTLNLRKGRNVIAAAVLHYPTNRDVGNRSEFRSKTPGLYLESCLEELSSDESWEAYDADEVRIVAEDPFFSPLWIYENAAGLPDIPGGEGTMEKAICYEEVENRFRPEQLRKRRIPPLYLEPSELLKETVEVPAHAHRTIVLDAGEETCAFLKLSLAGGSGAEVRLLQSESYVYDIPDPPKDYGDLPRKGDRTDSKNGRLHGFTDVYHVSGYGKTDAPEHYEPFWFRTYRYIKVDIRTGEDSLELLGLKQIKTGYPLEVKTKVCVSDPKMMKIWDMSLRTLKRCMLETYVDCPFYEQLQYAMDARNEIRYTYAVSGDDRLARQCIEDFERGQQENGLMNCCYPDVGVNVIPGFNIYVIGMLYDHMMYFGNAEFIKQHLKMAEKVLEYFHGHLNKDGIVEKIGGPAFGGGVWSFIDWTKEWNATRGVPAATQNGPIAMESLLYSYGLLMTEEMEIYVGQEAMARRFRRERASLNEAIRKIYMGPNGMIKDGPDIEQYSQHAQVFAVLTGLLPEGELSENLLRTLETPEAYAQCSVAMMPYLFEALRKTGQYEWTKPLWEVWKGMLKNHLTTCAEDGLSSRSDCHGWGALILYELPAVILGVHPTKPGFKEYEVKPMKEYFGQMSGEVTTPVGRIRVQIDDNGCSVEREENR